ncbi:MAG: hypothetical protein COA86_17935 [Kangiella sp.]|nr:MAG: hypothetical protein COA86_17935 [Kangiella sp.]
MNVLIIGGNGVIGSQLVSILENTGATVILIAKHPSILVKSSKTREELYIDRKCHLLFRQKLNATLKKINNQLDAVIDVIPFSEDDAKQTLELFGNRAKHIISISSSLVYKSSNLPKTEEYPTYKTHSHKYIQGKLDVENFWLNSGFKNYTIIRPHHIIGPGALMGCVPLHNRAKNILSLSELTLIEGGKIKLSFIHSRDLAQLIIGIIGKQESKGNLFNAVNPHPITALDYYQIIGEIRGKKYCINTLDKTLEILINSPWLPMIEQHIYSADKIIKLSGHDPKISLKTALKETHKYQLNSPRISFDIHHRMNGII